MGWTTNPGLTVTLGGQQLATALPADRVAVDELSVTWGTDDPLEQADPATGRLSLLDFTSSWAASASLIGQPVTAAWTPDAALTALTPPRTGRTYFRGRVTAVDVHPPDYVRLPDGTRVRAARVDLRLTSVETDLANRFATDGPWPTQPISERATKLAALAGVPVIVRDYWATQFVAQLTADDLAATSARDLLVQLYTACGGDRVVYDPHTQRYEWMGRRAANRATFGRLIHANPGDANGRAGLGYYAASAFSTLTTGPSTTFGDSWLDGEHLDAVDYLSKSAGQRITRARVTGFRGEPYAAEKYTSIRVDPAADESVIGQRAITHDSSLRYAGDVDLCADDLLAMATQEGAQWRPPPLTWDTHRTGGFVHPSQVDVLLRGAGAQHPVFVSRTWFAELGIRPVFAVVGGTITYTDGGWVVDTQLAGWAAVAGGNATPTPVKQHAISWEEIDSPGVTLVWSDTPTTFGLHESLTYEDAGFIGVGAGAGSWVGPDLGWDTYA